MILSRPAVFQLELWQWPFIQFARFIQIVRRANEGKKCKSFGRLLNFLVLATDVLLSL